MVGVRVRVQHGIHVEDPFTEGLLSQIRARIHEEALSVHLEVRGGAQALVSGV